MQANKKSLALTKPKQKKELSVKGEVERLTRDLFTGFMDGVASSLVAVSGRQKRITLTTKAKAGVIEAAFRFADSTTVNITINWEASQKQMPSGESTSRLKLHS